MHRGARTPLFWADATCTESLTIDLAGEEVLFDLVGLEDGHPDQITVSGVLEGDSYYAPVWKVDGIPAGSQVGCLDGIHLLMPYSDPSMAGSEAAALAERTLVHQVGRQWFYDPEQGTAGITSPPLRTEDGDLGCCPP